MQRIALAFAAAAALAVASTSFAATTLTGTYKTKIRGSSMPRFTKTS
jgi:hypothetical protein